ncbi:hypothetical protein [Amycolatopsis jiangsuensis]|uniref:DUF4267 domain-containing protein n=1 Tax=Amycolatopsis jiangsuensis TaxID=1181879 RepID=A0A840IQG3_9PSEU|nr:hypothetical protein [Amycolatopsis jiangsuensis]MBB4683442.1 hypothetical protein [Amycolatopsis jiangsuensis]
MIGNVSQRIGSRRGRARAGRVLVGLAGVVTTGGALAADFLVPATARQHQRNPRWPAHAKFHNAQYIVMCGLLGGTGLKLLTSDKGDPDRNLRVAAALLSTPWLGMYGATLFPGTAVVDEEFAALPNRKVLGIDGNLFAGTACLALLAAGVRLAKQPRSGSGG